MPLQRTRHPGKASSRGVLEESPCHGNSRVTGGLGSRAVGRCFAVWPLSAQEPTVLQLALVGIWYSILEGVYLVYVTHKH